MSNCLKIVKEEKTLILFLIAPLFFLVLSFPISSKAASGACKPSEWIEIDASHFDIILGTAKYKGEYECVIIKEIKYSSWGNEEILDNYNSMFSGTSVRGVELHDKNVKSMAYMFSDLKSETLELRNFNTGNVEQMQGMFQFSNIKNLDISKLDTKNVEDMSGMFQYSKIEELNIGSINVEKVKSMKNMFNQSNLRSLDLSNLNTLNVEDMSRMFSDMKYMKNLNISGKFKTSNVKDMSGMFAQGTHQDSEFVLPDLSNLDTRKVEKASHMFLLATTGILDLGWLNFDNLKEADGLASILDPVYIDLSTIEYDDMWNMTLNAKDGVTMVVVKNKQQRENAHKWRPAGEKIAFVKGEPVIKVKSKTNGPSKTHRSTVNLGWAGKKVKDQDSTAKYTWTDKNGNSRYGPVNLGLGDSQIQLPQSLPDGIYDLKIEASGKNETSPKESFSSTEIIENFILDRKGPTMSSSKNVNGWTNGNVTITVNAEDENGVSQIMRSNGSWIDGSRVNETVSSNGVYQYESKDNAGNTSKISVEVSNIDRSKPKKPTISGVEPGWSNKNSTVKISQNASNQVPSGIDYNEYRVDNGSWTKGSQVSISKNGKTIIQARSVSGSGVIGEISEAEAKIDKESPKITVDYDRKITNYDLNLSLSADFNNSGKGSIKVDGQTFNLVNGQKVNVKIKNNGKYTVIAESESGSTNSTTINIDNIDKELRIKEAENANFNSQKIGRDKYISRNVSVPIEDWRDDSDRHDWELRAKLVNNTNIPFYINGKSSSNMKFLGKSNITSSPSSIAKPLSSPKGSRNLDSLSIEIDLGVSGIKSGAHNNIIDWEIVSSI